MMMSSHETFVDVNVHSCGNFNTICT